jgi:hypothetical protein
VSGEWFMKEPAGILILTSYFLLRYSLFIIRYSSPLLTHEGNIPPVFPQQDSTTHKNNAS